MTNLNFKGMDNLLTDFAQSREREIFQTLLQRPGLRIERIVSLGQCSPPGFWYDQDEHEWVALLSGHASLMVEGEGAARQLRAGDHVYLPAHCRHRVESTSADEPAIWLALFWRESAKGEGHPPV